MGFFDFFKKKKKLNKDVIKVFNKIHDELTARQMTDQAISYRNLKQYDKAIDLLKNAIKKYHYSPAKNILGVTLLIKGDIDAAEKYLKKVVSEHIEKDDYPLIELYANLGSLYHNEKNDTETALKYYELALNAPKPTKAGISDKSYEIMLSGVFRDLCLIYFNKTIRQIKQIVTLKVLPQDFQLAKQYAFKRLQTEKKCPVASKVYGSCLFYDMLQRTIDLDKDSKDTDIENIVKYLQVAIANNPMDYASIAYCATSLFFLRHMEFYKSNQTLLKSMESKENEYIEQLKKCREQSDDANAAYEIYYGISLDFANSRSFDSEYRIIEFDPVNFLSFIQQKSSEKGIINCPNCGEPDIFFALGEKCAECGEPLPGRDKVKSLQFALEILREFIQKYDEVFPLSAKRDLIATFNSLILACLIDRYLPSTDNLAKLQVFNDIPIGGKKVAAVIKVEKGISHFTIAEEIKGAIIKNEIDPKAYVQSLTAVALAIQYILNLGKSNGGGKKV